MISSSLRRTGLSNILPTDAASNHVPKIKPLALEFEPGNFGKTLPHTIMTYLVQKYACALGDVVSTLQRKGFWSRIPHKASAEICEDGVQATSDILTTFGLGVMRSG